MDEKSLKAFHKAKNEQNAEIKFLKKCKKLEKQIAETEEVFSGFPPLETLTDPKERFKWLETKQQLEKLKADLKITRAVYTYTVYEKEGIIGIKSPKSQLEPGE